MAYTAPAATNRAWIPVVGATIRALGRIETQYENPAAWRWGKKGRLIRLQTCSPGTRFTLNEAKLNGPP